MLWPVVVAVLLPMMGCVGPEYAPEAEGSYETGKRILGPVGSLTAMPTEIVVVEEIQIRLTMRMMGIPHGNGTVEIVLPDGLLYRDGVLAQWGWLDSQSTELSANATGGAAGTWSVTGRVTKDNGSVYVFGNATVTVREG